ncbi:30S ribosomal protein S24e [Candidatus Bathyarchaeota archaeon]|nr:MAG: 30S ribosomal protein S24e [Candidatus Bathyarchaeota archaeon]
MKIEVIDKNYNKLLRRNEIFFRVIHNDAGGTPSRRRVREELARVLKEDVKNVFLIKLITKTGANFSIGTANIYENLNIAKEIEPDYIIARNLEEKKEES